LVRRAIGSASNDRDKAIAATSVTATATVRLISVERRMATAAVWTNAPVPESGPSESSPVSMSVPVRNRTKAASARHSSTPVAMARTATTPRRSMARRVEMRLRQPTAVCSSGGMATVAPAVGPAIGRVDSVSCEAVRVSSCFTPNQPLAQRVEGGLRAALQTQFRQQVGYVRLDGCFRHVESLGDALVGGPLGDVKQDF